MQGRNRSKLPRYCQYEAEVDEIKLIIIIIFFKSNSILKGLFRVITIIKHLIRTVPSELREILIYFTVFWSY